MKNPVIWRPKSNKTWHLCLTSFLRMSYYNSEFSENKELRCKPRIYTISQRLNCWLKQLVMTAGPCTIAL